MKGKIINSEEIEGEDGNLYNFNFSELNSAKEGDGMAITFTPNGLNATDIKIVGATNEVASLKNDLKSIKLKACLVAIAQILAFVIPTTIGNVFAIVKFVLEYMLTKEIKTKTHSQKILYNWTVSLVIGLILILIIVVLVIIEPVVREISSPHFYKILQIEKFFVYSVNVIGLIYLYRYYKELAYVTQKNDFKWIFWIYAVGIYSGIYSQNIYIIVSVIYAILYIYLWVKVGNLIHKYMYKIA